MRLQSQWTEIHCSITEIKLRRLSVAEVQDENVNDNSPEAVRLHNFLSYCLTVDYGTSFTSVSCDIPSLAKCDHYVELSEVIMAVWEVRRSNRVLTPYYRKHQVEPCVSLGVPVDVAELVVIRFCWCRNRGRIYKGCVREVGQQLGMRALACKLWTDRQFLIPNLEMSENERLELNKALLMTARRYFTPIDGTDSTMAIFIGREAKPEEAMIKFTLSAQGRNLRDNPTKTLTLRQRVVRFVMRGVARLLRVNLQPQSSLPIFPESSE